jgi:hypothetical protein
MVFTRRYNTSATGALAIRLPLIKAGVTSYAVSADWTPGAGDVLVSKDGAAFANITDLPTYTNDLWTFTLTATELSCKSLVVKIIDAAVENDAFVVETYGHASAMNAVDWSIAPGATGGLATHALLLATSRAIHGSDYAVVLHDGDNATSGATLKSVAEAATAGTVVIVGPGTYALGNAAINANITLIGAGDNRTIITSTAITGDFGAILNVAEVRHLRVTPVGTAADGQIAWGVRELSGQTVWSRYRAVGCWFDGDLDGVFFQMEFATTTAELERCRVHAKYDAVRWGVETAASTLYVRDCDLEAIGPAAAGTLSRGVASTGGTTYVTGGRIHASGSAVSNSAVYNTAAMHLAGVTLTSAGTAALDIETAIAGVTSVAACAYDPAKTSGTITAAYAQANVVSAATDAISAASVSAAAVTKITTGLPTTTTVMDANVVSVNGVAAETTDTVLVNAASVRTALGLAAANLDTQLSSLSTLDAAQIRAAVGLALANLDEQLAALAASSGNGINDVTITVTDGTDPLENALVRVRQGAENYTLPTAADGTVVFHLSAATWAVAIHKPGYLFTATTLEVDGAEAVTYAMTAVNVAAPAAAGCSTGVLLCVNTSGLPEASVPVTFKMTSGPGTAGYAFNANEFTLSSDANGLISHTGFVIGATYLGRSRSGATVSFTVADQASFDLPQLLGRT